MKTTNRPLLLFESVNDLYEHLGISINLADYDNGFAIYNMGNLYHPNFYDTEIYFMIPKFTEQISFRLYL